MIEGPSTRHRKNHKQYIHHQRRRKSDCDFCNFSIGDGQVVEETTLFWVVKNIFAYNVWDDLAVVDHLMIIPKRHIIGMHEFSETEILDYFTIMTGYEEKGYSLYARAPKNIGKSVIHQHSHLIKLGSSTKKFMFYIRKPHILVTK